MCCAQLIAAVARVVMSQTRAPPRHAHGHHSQASRPAALAVVAGFGFGLDTESRTRLGTVGGAT